MEMEMVTIHQMILLHPVTTVVVDLIAKDLKAIRVTRVIRERKEKRERKETHLKAIKSHPKSLWCLWPQSD
jgi:hypothetical protein